MTGVVLLPLFLGNTKLRKYLTPPQRILIAAQQSYRCPGELCRNKQLLPSTWELDHIRPLCFGGDNSMKNLQILCPNCHALKTQREQIYYNGLKENSATQKSNTNPPLYFDRSSNRYVITYVHRNKRKRKSFSCAKYKGNKRTKLKAISWYREQLQIGVHSLQLFT